MKTKTRSGQGLAPSSVRQFPTQRTTSDCFSACLSWLLGLPQDDVPDFTGPDEGGFYRRVADWLRPRGLRMMLIGWPDMPAMLGGPIIARGLSERNKAHAVVWDDNGLLHDPHPSRAGLVGEPTHAMLIIVLPNAVMSQPAKGSDLESPAGLGLAP